MILKLLNLILVSKLIVSDCGNSISPPLNYSIKALIDETFLYLFKRAVDIFKYEKWYTIYGSSINTFIYIFFREIVQVELQGRFQAIITCPLQRIGLFKNRNQLYRSSNILQRNEPPLSCSAIIQFTNYFIHLNSVIWTKCLSSITLWLICTRCWFEMFHI